MERVPVFICILGTIHVVQGQSGYIYNRPNDPINEGTIATLPVPSGFQPATTKSPDRVVELGKAQNPVDGFPGAHLPGQTLGNGDYHSENQPSFPSGFREDSRHLTGPEPGSYPILSENSLSQTTSSGFSGHSVSTEPFEEPRPQGYYETVDSLNPPGSKTQGAQPSPGSQEDSNGFNGNQIQNTYSAGHPGTQNHGLSTSDQTGSTESSLLSTGQYRTTVPSFTTGPTSFPTHLQEGLSFTTFSAGQTHRHDTSDLGLSYGGGGDSDDGSYKGGDYSAIPGEPGIDYPIFSDIPQTTFRCEEQQWPGYYADVEARCQLFHICTNNTSYDFLCPNGTVFSQEYFVCVWWNQFNCNNAPNFFYLNEKIYDYSIMGSQLTEGNFPSFPGVSPPENMGGLQVLQGTNANLDGSKLSLESSAVPREPPTSFQPSTGTNGQNAPLGGPSTALFGHNVPLGQTNGPSGPTASFGPSTFQPFAGPHGPTGTLGPTESFGPTPISPGPSGSFELPAVPQGPSTSLQPSTSPPGPAVVFGSTASFPRPGGLFESSTIPQRPVTTFYPSTGPYSQNAPAGQSNGPTESFEPNPPLEQSNGSLVPFGSNESSSGPRGPIASFGLKGTPHRPGVPIESSAVPQKPSTLYQPSNGPYSYNVPIGQSNGPLGPTASSGPSTSLQPFAGPQGPTGPIGLTESFNLAARLQGPSGSFESSAIPQKPSTPFQPSSGPYRYNAPLGQSNGPVEPASSLGPNAPLSPSNHLVPFGPSAPHESSSGAQGSTASFGSAETPHRSGGSFESSVVHQEPSTPFQPSAGPNGGNAPLEQSYGPAGPAPSFGPNAPLAQSNVPFGPPAPQQSSSGARDPTASFSSTETPYGPGGSFETTEVYQKPSTPFQSSIGPYHYDAPLGQSNGPTGPTALFEPNTPLEQTKRPAVPGTSFGPNAQLQPSNEPSGGPQVPTTSVQLLTGPNGQNAPLGQSNGPIRPDASFDPNASLGQSNRPFGPATSFQPAAGPQEPTGPQGHTKLFVSTPLLQGPSGPFQPSTGPYSYNAPVGQSNEPAGPGASFGSNIQLQPSEGPQGPTFQSFTGPNGPHTPNIPLVQSNGPFGPSTSFQPPLGPQKPTGPPGQTESFGSTPLPQGPSGSFESFAVPQEPSTSFHPFTEPQTPSVFNPSTGSYVESQVPALSDLSSPQGAYKPVKPSTSTGYIESQHLSSLDTKRPGEQTSVSQDQQGSFGPFGSYPSGTPDSSGYKPASLQSGLPGPKPNNGYLPPYRYGS